MFDFKLFFDYNLRTIESTDFLKMSDTFFTKRNFTQQYFEKSSSFYKKI